MSFFNKQKFVRCVMLCYGAARIPTSSLAVYRLIWIRSVIELMLVSLHLGLLILVTYNLWKNIKNETTNPHPLEIKDEDAGEPKTRAIFPSLI